MYTRLNSKLIKNIDVILLSLVLIILYSYLVFFSSDIINSDFYAHIDHIVKVNESSEIYPSNFILFFVTNLLTFFSIEKIKLYSALILLLFLSTIFKYIISKKIIGSLLRLNNVSQKTIILLALIVFCFYAIPDPYLFFIKKRMYVGKFVPTVWHNSTTILVFPFTLLLFWHQFLIISGEKKTNFKTLLFICILIFFNAYIKPSFIFVYIPSTFVFLLLNFVRKKTELKLFIINCIPLIFGFLCISIVSIFTYIFQIGSPQDADSKIGFDIFYIYKLSYQLYYLPIVLFFCYLLPIASIIFYPEILKYSPFTYALIICLFSLMISFTFIEEGPRLLHGNFIWQNVFSTYILFITTLVFIFRKVFIKPVFNFKFYMFTIIVLAHFCSGLLYLTKYIITHNYL